MKKRGIEILKTTEHQEQCKFIDWVRLHENRYTALRSLFAVPNGGHRHIGVARKLKAEGVKAGVPDILLLYSKYRIKKNEKTNALTDRELMFHGLAIEMKIKGNKTTPLQKEWLERLDNDGYETAVCYSANDAINVIKEYLGIQYRSPPCVM